MIESWFNSVLEGLKQFGEALDLAVESWSIEEVPTSWSGAVIPITGADNTYLVGLMASEDELRKLAARLLDVDVETATVGHEEMDDAIGELVNLSAGAIKSHAANVESTIELGLPVWLDGPPNTRQALDFDVRGIEVGEAKVAAMLLKLPLAVETVVRRKEEERRENLEQEIRLNQKLEAVGQLAAGIAHEINTPTQYVSDNIEFLIESFGELNDVLKAYAALRASAEKDDLLADVVSSVREAEEQADLEYLIEEIPRALAQSAEGAASVAKIVQGMKVFSHPGSPTKTAVDLNQAVEATATVSRNEWKYVADLETDLDPSLPMVPCMIGELNQVMLNMVVNAAHALAELHGEDDKGSIRITTRLDAPDWAVIEIADSGAGIPEDTQSRIFDPFFTTKDVGKGTGQGLAIARSVVVDKHGGTIGVESEVGRGTTFTIRLPLEDAPAVDRADA